MELCYRCKKYSPEPGRVSCKKCLWDACDRANKNRASKRKRGECLDCNTPSAGEHSFCETHLEKRRAVSKKNVKVCKEAALTYYSGHACVWPGCDVTDADMLTLDHIKDDGAAERKTVRRLGVVLFSYLRRRGWPSGYQVLCANHQIKKELMRRRGGNPAAGGYRWPSITKYQ